MTSGWAARGHCSYTPDICLVLDMLARSSVLQEFGDALRYLCLCFRNRSQGSARLHTFLLLFCREEESSRTGGESLLSPGKGQVLSKRKLLFVLTIRSSLFLCLFSFPSPHLLFPLSSFLRQAGPNLLFS